VRHIKAGSSTKSVRSSGGVVSVVSTNLGLKKRGKENARVFLSTPDPAIQGGLGRTGNAAGKQRRRGWWVCGWMGG
jgi:hypothetical protein